MLRLGTLFLATLSLTAAATYCARAQQVTGEMGSPSAGHDALTPGKHTLLFDFKRTVAVSARTGLAS